MASDAQRGLDPMARDPLREMFGDHMGGAGTTSTPYIIYQHTLSTHSINRSVERNVRRSHGRGRYDIHYQHAVSTRAINTSISHSINTPYQHTTYQHSVNTLYQSGNPSYLFDLTTYLFDSLFQVWWVLGGLATTHPIYSTTHPIYSINTTYSFDD